MTDTITLAIDGQAFAELILPALQSQAALYRRTVAPPTTVCDHDPRLLSALHGRAQIICATCHAISSELYDERPEFAPKWTGDIS